MEEDLKKQIQNLTEQVEMLKEFAGKNAIASWEDARKDFKLKFCHFKLWNDKPIIGWDKLDYSQFNQAASDGYRENVFTMVYFPDGSKEKMNYMIFINIKDLIHAKLVDGLGVERSLVEFEDGKQILVENRFLNA